MSDIKPGCVRVFICDALESYLQDTEICKDGGPAFPYEADYIRDNRTCPT